MAEFPTELVAKICYYANLAWHDHYEKDYKPLWDFAPYDTRQGYLAMTRRFSEGATEAEVHNEFVASRIKDGWQYMGSRDVEKKWEPYLQSYSALQPRMKLKYELFRAIVEAFRASEWIQ